MNSQKYIGMDVHQVTRGILFFFGACNRRACLCKRSDGLRVRRVGAIVRRQSTTEILSTLNNRFHSGQ